MAQSPNSKNENKYESARILLEMLDCLQKLQRLTLRRQHYERKLTDFKERDLASSIKNIVKNAELPSQIDTKDEAEKTQNALIGAIAEKTEQKIDDIESYLNAYQQHRRHQNFAATYVNFVNQLIRPFYENQLYSPLLMIAGVAVGVLLLLTHPLAFGMVAGAMLIGGITYNALKKDAEHHKEAKESTITQFSNLFTDPSGAEKNPKGNSKKKASFTN